MRKFIGCPWSVGGSGECVRGCGGWNKKITNEVAWLLVLMLVQGRRIKFNKICGPLEERIRYEEAKQKQEATGS